MISGALPPITNRQSYIDEIEVYSDLDNTPFDLTGATVQVVLASSWTPASGNNWITPYYDVPSGACVLISAATAIIATGVVQFTFTEAQLFGLAPGLYKLAATLSRGGETVQVLLGDLPVIDGVVPL